MPDVCEFKPQKSIVPREFQILKRSEISVVLDNDPKITLAPHHPAETRQSVLARHKWAPPVLYQRSTPRYVAIHHHTYTHTSPLTVLCEYTPLSEHNHLFLGRQQIRGTA